MFWLIWSELIKLWTAIKNNYTMYFKCPINFVWILFFFLAEVTLARYQYITSLEYSYLDENNRLLSNMTRVSFSAYRLTF